jgi:hypothetical protein
MQIVQKKMKAYGAVDLDKKIIYINPAKNKGIEGLDTRLHEINHLKNSKMSERAIINKTKGQRDVYQAII